MQFRSHADTDKVHYFKEWAWHGAPDYPLSGSYVAVAAVSAKEIMW